MTRTFEIISINKWFPITVSKIKPLIKHQDECEYLKG